jgi:hypothetical protein
MEAAIPDADRAHVGVHVLHRVVNGQPISDNAARGVDVEADVALAVLGVEQQQFGADPVGRVVVHFGAQEDDALAQESLIEVIRAESVGSVGDIHASNLCARLRNLDVRRRLRLLRAWRNWQTRWF